MLHVVLLKELNITLDHAERDSWKSKLPTTHTKDCLDGLSTEHWNCHAWTVNDVTAKREWYKKIKEEFLASIHPEAIETIHNGTPGMGEYARSRYANSMLVADAHWEYLRDDKQAVREALASNPGLPESIAVGLVLANDSSWLLASIAAETDSQQLLDMIWAKSKSEMVRQSIMLNTVSGRQDFLRKDR